MFLYRGLGYLGILLPALLALALNYGLQLLEIDWRSPRYQPPLWWLFGVVFIIAGVVVFLLGRRVNGVSGPPLTSYRKDKPPARHTLNGFALEKAGPVSVAIGLGILVYYAASVLR